MSSDESFYAIDIESLIHGKLKHSCGGVLCATFGFEGTRLSSITCNKCNAGARYDSNGNCVEMQGNVLDLDLTKKPVEGNA